MRTRERSSVERIRIALMEKRVMLGDIFAMGGGGGGGGGGGWGGSGRWGLFAASLTRCRRCVVEALF